DELVGGVGLKGLGAGGRGEEGEEDGELHARCCSKRRSRRSRPSSDQRLSASQPMPKRAARRKIVVAATTSGLSWSIRPTSSETRTNADAMSARRVCSPRRKSRPRASSTKGRTVV